jgi:hypothetical protein
MGGTVDKLWAKREEKREAEAKVKVIEAEIASIEESLMERMDKEATTKSQGTKASVSVTQTTVANVTDWEAFHAYVAKNKYFHLLQKRVSDPAVRELWDGGKKVPGVQPFAKRKLNVHTLNV